MAELKQKNDGALTTFLLKGVWTIEHFQSIQGFLSTIKKCKAEKIIFDGRDLEMLDSSVAFLMMQKANALKSNVSFENTEKFDPVLAVVNRLKKISPAPTLPPKTVADRLAWIGERTFGLWASAVDLFSFIGYALVYRARLFLRPQDYKLKATLFHVARTGFDALPIVGLLTFLVGVVLAYQGAVQLEKFGAEIFTVNLLGISILREVGILLAAIIMAGRSGSAFTAQIGTMKVNQEVDALETIGIDPMNVLVVPRLDALMITLPLLTFYGNLCALIGGAITCRFALDISFDDYVQQLKGAVDINHMWVGLFKSPIFAFMIAATGCYEGLKVSGSAESVGVHTTRSVVKGIFIVIVLDALFSVMFAMMDV